MEGYNECKKCGYYPLKGVQRLIALCTDCRRDEAIPKRNVNPTYKFSNAKSKKTN